MHSKNSVGSVNIPEFSDLIHVTDHPFPQHLRDHPLTIKDHEIQFNGLRTQDIYNIESNALSS